MIVLTKDQANQVRGLTVYGHALAPRPMSIQATAALAGKFILPESCLSDPTHAPYRALLASFPTVPDSSIKMGVYDPTTGKWTIPPDFEIDPVKTAPHIYQPSWPVGQVVVVP